jgi:hypothetical protein
MPQIASQKYNRLRAGLIRRGHTIASWARLTGYRVSSVYDAAKGNRAGVKSVRIQKQLEDFINA